LPITSVILMTCPQMQDLQERCACVPVGHCQSGFDAG
jgi:hypothetical protein